MVREEAVMTLPSCSSCEHGTITQHSSGDRCEHENNTGGHHPYALRHDATLCGATATWFEKRPAPATVYKAAAN